MKKLITFDNLILESDLGYDPATGWSIPNNVRSVEFEDGTLLENPNFDPVGAKAARVLQIENAVLSASKDKTIADQLGLTGKSVELQISIDQLLLELQTLKQGEI